MTTPSFFDELISPLSREAFIKESLDGRAPHASHGAPERFRSLADIDGLESAEAIIARYRGDVLAFGPGGLRLSVSADQAWEVYSHGMTLYLIRAHRVFPELRAFVREIAEGIGVAENAVDAEVFLSRKGAPSSLHCDHDCGFNVLLSGRKRFRFANNQVLVDPLESYTPHHAHTRSNHAHLVAPGAEFPGELPPGGPTFVAEGGTCVFLPRGVWHETEALEDSLQVNFAAKAPLWGELALSALRQRLMEATPFRGWVRGIETDEGPSAEEAQRFETEIKRHLLSVVEELTADELFWSQDDRYLWPDPPPRVLDQGGARALVGAQGAFEDGIELDDDLGPVIDKLLSLTGVFTVATAVRFANASSYEWARKVLDALVEEELLQKIADPRDQPS